MKTMLGLAVAMVMLGGVAVSTAEASCGWVLWRGGLSSDYIMAGYDTKAECAGDLALTMEEDLIRYRETEAARVAALKPVTTTTGNIRSEPACNVPGGPRPLWCGPPPTEITKGYPDGKGGFTEERPAPDRFVSGTSVGGRLGIYRKARDGESMVQLLFVCLPAGADPNSGRR